MMPMRNRWHSLSYLSIRFNNDVIIVARAPQDKSFFILRRLFFSVDSTKGKTMKKVEAIIQPFKLEEVRKALSDIGLLGMILTEVKGFGRQMGHREQYRGAEYAVGIVTKIKKEIALAEAEEERVVAPVM